MTYLSIDLDYWLMPYMSDLPPYAGLFQLLRQVKAENWLVVDEHHELLPHINAHRPNSILHVDYHTDVAYPTINKAGQPPDIELNCGTFFWFADNRQAMDYTWFYPESECPRGAGLCMDDKYKPLARKNWIFKQQKRKLGLPTKQQLAEVTSVGIAVSEDFCQSSEILVRLLKVLRRRYLPHNTVWQLPNHLEVALSGTSLFDTNPAPAAAQATTISQAAPAANDANEPGNECASADVDEDDDEMPRQRMRG